MLQGHAHPSVTAMATAVLAGEAVVYDGDPLRDLALPAFLDKFVRRKQKVSTNETPLTKAFKKASRWFLGNDVTHHQFWLPWIDELFCSCYCTP